MIKRRPKGKEWISVPDTGNIEAGVAASKFCIAHLSEVFPENKGITGDGVRWARQ